MRLGATGLEPITLLTRGSPLRLDNVQFPGKPLRLLPERRQLQLVTEHHLFLLVPLLLDLGEGGLGAAAGGKEQDDGNKYLARLSARMGSEKFSKNWRIQVIRLSDTDEVRAVEKEVKESLCTYHVDAALSPESCRSAFGLNGN